MIGFGFSLTGLFTLGSPSVTQSPPASPLDLSISATRLSGVAPMGVIFTAIASGGGVADPFRDIYYVWDFGDPGASFTAIDSSHPHGTDANSAIGPSAAHVYEADGVHTATVTAFWFAGGVLQSQQATLDVTATTLASEFNDAVDTICYSAAGDFAGAPAGATQISDTATLNAELSARVFDLRLKVLFRAGETHELTDTAFWRAGGHDHAIGYVGSFGAGARPEVSVVGRTSVTSKRSMSFFMTNGEVIIDGVDFFGGYDPVGHELTGTHYKQAVEVFNQDYLTVVNSNARGCTAHVFDFVSAADQKGVAIFSNCAVTDWLDYGILHSGGDFAAVGSVIKQDPNTAFGVVGKGESADATEIYADHGPLRVNHANDLAGGIFVVSKCDVFSRGGWSAYGSTTAHQPCLRFEVSDLLSGNGLPVVTQNRLEGGFHVISIANASGTADHINKPCLIESNYMIADEQSDAFITYGAHGATIRNNVGYKPDVAEAPAATFFNAFVQIVYSGGGEVTTPDNTYIGFNTSISDQSAANAGNGSALNFQMAQQLDATAVDVTVADNVVRATGFANAASFPDDNPLDAANVYRPQAGSGALGAATTPPPVADFGGNLRNFANTARGAWGAA